MKGVRGASQIDWIISLAFFMLYLGFFFVFLQNQITPVEDDNGVLDLVEDGIREDAKTAINKIPLVVHSNITGTELVVADFPLTWTNFSFVDNRSYLLDDKLFFESDLSENTFHFIVTSDEGYEIPLTVQDLVATNDVVFVNTKGFSAEFDTLGIVRTIQHLGERRMSDYNVTIDGLLFSTQDIGTTITTRPFAATYEAESITLQHKSHVFAGYGRMYSYLELLEKGVQRNVTISATILNATNYYVDVVTFGAFDYDEETCTTSEGTFIDFFDPDAGISFMTEDVSEFEYCVTDGAVQFSMKLQFVNESSFRIMTHEDDYETTEPLVSPYSVEYGYIENVSALSYQGIKSINQTEYRTLKTDWNFPRTQDFAYTISNVSGGVIYRYEPINVPKDQDILAKTITLDLSDKYGNTKTHTVRIQSW